MRRLAKLLGPFILIRMWWERQQAASKRYYVERRIIERQLREMIADTHHFQDATVLKRMVDYTMRYDKEQKSVPCQTLFSLMAEWRPSMAHAFKQ